MALCGANTDENAMEAIWRGGERGGGGKGTGAIEAKVQTEGRGHAGMLVHPLVDGLRRGEHATEQERHCGDAEYLGGGPAERGEKPQSWKAPERRMSAQGNYG